MKLFIIIVSYNGGETLDKLIRDLIKENAVKIVVVENGIEESRITNHESRITVIKNKENLGFAKAVNIGIKYALQNNAERILFLNQDIVIENGFIQKLIASSADIVSPVIKFKRGNNWIFDYGGKIDWNIGRTSHLESIVLSTSFRAQARNLSRMRDYHSNNGSASLTTGLRDPSASVGMTNVDYVSGCAMMIKRQVFEKIGLLDEHFFLYFEDADFCLRARKAGFTITVEPESVITHELIEGKERSIFKKYHLLRSNAIFINKYLRLNRLLGYLYLVLLAVKITVDRFLHHPRSPSATSEVS